VCDSHGRVTNTQTLAPALYLGCGRHRAQEEWLRADLVIGQSVLLA
jgi:hypothetical protein